MHIIQKRVKIYGKKSLACCIHWLPSKPSSADELNDVVWSKDAISQYMNPEILPVLNSQKQGTKYRQNGAKIRKWLKYLRKKEPHLYSVFNRLFVPAYVNFDKTWTYHWVFQERKKTPVLLEESQPSLSHLTVTHIFFILAENLQLLSLQDWKPRQLFYPVSVYIKSHPYKKLWVCSYLRIGQSRILKTVI